MIGKKLFSSIMVPVFALTLMASVVSAKGPDRPAQKPESIDLVESEIHYAPSIANQGQTRTTIPVQGVDKKKQYKKSLLDFFTSNPKYSESISQIDTIVNQAIVSESANTASADGEITPYVIVGQGWTKAPYVTFSQNRVTYATSWIPEDNYRSNVPVTVSYTKTMTISATLGFSGSGLIKDKMGFQVSAGVNQTTSITQGATIPSWTVWGKRPYIKYRLEEWAGIYYYIDSTGGIVQVIEGPVTGTNKVLITKSTEYWTRTNTAESTTATTPTPPTGPPNV
ncbi:hypothetical protein [Paenibacillus montanisoli]|uniref:Uncharacterized protein n=1 Tax=Paenibacillus montanisoli TaxID=2081970 RepID=A0A328TXG0_9BACL|nr:hypothetical protein [Paenibacillus montanisoli]RAP75120.1 hypothetical protein DL346_17190 [Paenibacillus montanisoli]